MPICWECRLRVNCGPGIGAGGPQIDWCTLPCPEPLSYWSTVRNGQTYWWEASVFAPTLGQDRAYFQSHPG